MNQTRQNKKAVFGFLTLLSAPFIGAYFALHSGWYQSLDTTANGHFVTPSAYLGQLQLSTSDGQPFGNSQAQGNWWLLYHIPEQCDSRCQNTLIQLRQIDKALGANQLRLKPMLVLPTMSDDFNQHLLEPLTDATLLTRDKTDSDWRDHVLLIDPLGQLVLSYPANQKQQASIDTGRLLIKDIQKLFKLSRIG